MALGRPPMPFDQAIADEVCEELMLGKSLKAVCTPDHMPSMITIIKWTLENKEFGLAYQRAREIQADTLIDEIHEIADNQCFGETTVAGFSERGHFEKTTTGDMIQHRTLQIETRKWIASKMRPRKYGAPQQVIVLPPESPAAKNISDAMTAQEASDAYQDTLNE